MRSNHQQLLVVFLTKYRNIRPNQVKQPRYHGDHAVEMARAGSAFEDIRQRRGGLETGRIAQPAGVDGLIAGRENQVAAQLPSAGVGPGPAFADSARNPRPRRTGQD